MSATPLIPMGDLGTHPMAIMASTFLFDNYAHLRNDMLRPNGPIDRPEPPRDEKRLRPTIEWMLAGLPWMCAEELQAVVDKPITLTLEGAGGGTWTIGPGGDDGRVAVEREGGTRRGRDGHVEHRTRLRDLGNQAAPWRELVTIEGDADYAAEYSTRSTSSEAQLIDGLAARIGSCAGSRDFMRARPSCLDT